MLALFLATLSALAAPKASSELTDGDGKHPAAMAFDGLLGSGWAEGAPGSGESQWLELDLGKATEIATVSIWPGNLKEGAKSYREYSRPKVIQLYLDGQPVGEPQRLQDKIQRLDVPVKGTGRKVKIEVVESYEGFVFTDLFIAEVALDFPSRAQLGRLDTWLASKDAARVQETWSTTVADAYAKHKEAEFGDDAAFAVLTDAVADGAPWMRERARSLAPEGYRAQAVPSDPVAQSAVRKLKDPNGIPSFELAMLRATKEEARAMQDVVEIFYAYQELIGGGNRNVPYWGQTGWEPGALRGFGEPASLAIDATGAVYVADTGNNRVQIYADNGRPNGQWGAKADITDAWFANGRKFYVSGAAPGEKPGELYNPVDIERIPGKEEDLFAVLDARGRVQLFGVDGKVRISWTVQTENVAEAEMGGQAYLLWVPQKERLYAIIQNEAVGYTLTAEEVARFTIKDGTPKSAIVDPKGKLMFAIGDQFIGYDPDGFRYGAMFDPRVLGEGFEDLDMALDEKGKLWILTDAGMIFKFKRPGKLEFKVEISEMPLPHPRMLVNAGIVHYTAGDKVTVADVLQIKLDAEQAEAEAAAERKASGEGQ